MRVAGAFLALAGTLAVVGCAGGRALARPGASPAAAQALRTCVDRWNQDNMLGWGSMWVRIAFRALNARERSLVSFGDDAQRRCTVSIARRPGDNSWICRIDATGGYECPLHTSDGMPPLRNANGKADRRGVVKLAVPLKGTRATPPLSWQRRYPHVDGYILPWTPAGALRRGLRFVGTQRGSCGFFVETVVPRSAGRCVSSAGEIFEPCFPRGRDFRPRDVAACSGPGSTKFLRWVVTGRL